MDLRDSVENVAELVQGVDAIYFTAGSRGLDLLQTDAFGAVKLMQAAELADVKRFVMLSSFQATDPSQWEIYQEMDHVDYIIAKFFADNYLIHQTNLDYSILQPIVLVEAEVGDGQVSLGQVQAKQNTIPNVAKVLAALVRHPESIGKVLVMSDGAWGVEQAFENLSKESIMKETIERSVAIREAYHKLEEANHGSRWSIEEDLLALSNDVGNMQRLVMTKQGRYYDETPYRLESKVAENIWWLLEVANRLDIDVEAEMEEFLREKEELLKIEKKFNGE